MPVKDDEEASLLALLANMDDDKKKEEESLMAAINGIEPDDQADEVRLLEEAIHRLGDGAAGTEDPQDEAAELERAILALPDEDDLEAMVNALPDDDSSAAPAPSVETLQQLIREEKLAALKHKRSGDLDKAKAHLRKSKDLQRQLDAVMASPGGSAMAPTAEEYKQLAVKMTREGKMDLARKYLRLSKQATSAEAEAGEGEGGSPPVVEDPPPMAAVEIPPEYLSEPTGAPDLEPEPALSADALRQRIREEKVEALKHKRGGDLDKARAHLRRSKELQKQLDAIMAE